ATRTDAGRGSQSRYFAERKGRRLKVAITTRHEQTAGAAQSSESNLFLPGSWSFSTLADLSQVVAPMNEVKLPPLVRRQRAQKRMVHNFGPLPKPALAIS